MSHDEFVEKIAKTQPRLEVVGTYVNKRNKVKCRCRDCGFEWSSFPHVIYKSKGCLKCNGFYRRTHEEFVLDITKNNPNIEVIGHCESVRAKVYCRCKICGHEWATRVGALIDGSSCPKCQHIKMRKPQNVFVDEIASILPNVVVGQYYGNDNTVHCQCKICGYEWDGRPRSLRRGYGCANCKQLAPKTKSIINNTVYRSSQTKSHEQFIKEAKIANSKITITGTYINSKEKVACKCNACDYEWSMFPGNILKSRGCPECAKSQTSFLERYILFALQEALGETNVLSRDRAAITKELDIYIPQLHAAIEPGRWYWHKRKLAHDKEKYKLCQLNGIRLLTIYDEFDGDRNELELPNDFITYKEKFGDSNKKEELKKCLIDIFNMLDVPYLFTKEQEERLFDKAKFTTSRKTTQDIIFELQKIYDDIELIDSYRDSKTKMRCRCKSCGHVWESNYDHLIRRKQGCPNCYQNKNLVVNMDTGEIFKNAVTASKSLGMSQNSVSIVCRGINQTCAGYHWAYISSLTPEQIAELRTKFPDTFTL